jgi:hypothetical protein
VVWFGERAKARAPAGKPAAPSPPASAACLSPVCLAGPGHAASGSSTTVVLGSLASPPTTTSLPSSAWAPSAPS